MPFRSSDVSRTSQVVALIRARLDRPHTPKGDPDAQQKLCQGMKPTSATLLRNITARTRFFDEQVVAAISAGVPQVVVCGAGYDDRALRFFSEGVRFIELDHPSTQSDKIRRLRSMKANLEKLTLVSTDFRTDDVVTLLNASGHDATRPSLFICEGLLVYLDQQTGRRLLAGLRSVAASGSKLAVSLAIHPARENLHQIAASANARRRAGQTEPWLTILSSYEFVDIFKQLRWHVDLTIGDEGLDTNSGSRMSLVTAVPS